MWIYILLMISMGSALLFFEVALGQYSCKGFAKVFSMCPLFEGCNPQKSFNRVGTSFNLIIFIRDQLLHGVLLCDRIHLLQHAECIFLYLYFCVLQ